MQLETALTCQMSNLKQNIINKVVNTTDFMIYQRACVHIICDPYHSQ